MAPRRCPTGSSGSSETSSAASGLSSVIGVLKCPKELDKVGKKKWKELVKLRTAMGILTIADGDMMELYCAACSRRFEAEAKLKQYGFVLNSKKGGVYLSPFLFVRNDASKEMQRLACLLGLTGPKKQPIKDSGALAGHANMTEAETTEALTVLASMLSALEAAHERSLAPEEAVAGSKGVDADADVGVADLGRDPIGESDGAP